MLISPFASIGDQVQKITWQLYNNPFYPSALQILLPRITGTLIHSAARITDCALTLILAISCAAKAISYKTFNIICSIQDCQQVTDELFQRAIDLSGLCLFYLLDIPTCWIFNLINPSGYQEFYTETSSEETAPWIVIPPSIPGFKNLSTNCAFNSCLQVLLHHPEFREIFEVVTNHCMQTEENKICGENMLAVLKAYDNATMSKKSILSDVSQKMRLAIHHLNPKISKNPSQYEDVHEIITTLIKEYEKIITEANLLKSSSIHYKNQEITYYKPRKKTIRKKRITTKKEYTDWQILIHLKAKEQKLKLVEKLEEYFDNKNVTDWEPRCIHNTDVKVQRIKSRFINFPKILTFQLGRFANTSNAIAKVTTDITIAEEITIPGLATMSNYELSSFITHRGGLNNGHYVAYLKKENKWVECDDQSSAYADKSILLDNLSKSYMCFYRLKTIE